MRGRKHISSRRNSRRKPTEEQGVMGDNNEKQILQILEGLANGKQQLAQTLDTFNC
jgi:hypothetical protein